MRVTRRAVLRALAATAAGSAAGGGAYGFLYERHALDVTRTTVDVAGLAPALNGLRVGLLTDVHRSSFVSYDDVAHAVAQLMAARPDVVVLGGDYVTWGDRSYVGRAAEALAPLSAPHGVFAILGNHDDDRDMPAALARNGFTVLKDARTRITVNGEPFDFVGVRFWTRRTQDIAPLLKGSSANTVLLAHDPRRLTEAATLGVPLVLSGHTHGGQVVLPLVGAIAAEKFPVVAGIGRRDRTTMYVSRGIGTILLPVRINCPPEVAILTLQREGETRTA